MQECYREADRATRSSFAQHCLTQHRLAWQIEVRGLDSRSKRSGGLEVRGQANRSDGLGWLGPVNESEGFRSAGPAQALLIKVGFGGRAGPGPPMKVKDLGCLLYTSPSPRDLSTSRMPSSA